MGQPVAPLTPQSQQLNKGVSQVASATGTATFTFDSPPMNTTWTGTLTCAGAPATAIFLAMVGATSWGDWAGASVYGPVQCGLNGIQQLVVTATGLAAGVTYEMEWTGSSDPSDSVAAIWPDATASAQQVQFGQATQLFNGFNLSPTSLKIVETVTIPTNVKTLLISIISNVGNPPTEVLVTGNVTQLNYYQQLPYLNKVTTSGIDYLVVVPFPSSIDTSVTVTVFTTTSGSLAQLTVFGDTAQYDETVFYNGVLQAASGGTGTPGVGDNFLTGPCRLLTVALGNASNTLASILLNGVGSEALLQVQAGGSQNIDFGEGIILPSGSVLQLLMAGGGAGAVYGSATYAYP